MRKLTHSKYSSNDRLLIVNIREKKLQSREITDCSFFQHTILFSAYEITDEKSLRNAIVDYIRFYSKERLQDRYNCKTPLKVRQEGLASDNPTEYPIPENKRINKYKEKWCA